MELDINEIVEQLTERGKVEFELAQTRALNVKLARLAQELTERVEAAEAARDDEPH